MLVIGQALMSHSWSREPVNVRPRSDDTREKMSRLICAVADRHKMRSVSPAANSRIPQQPHAPVGSDHAAVSAANVAPLSLERASHTRRAASPRRP